MAKIPPGYILANIVHCECGDMRRGVWLNKPTMTTLKPHKKCGSSNVLGSMTHSVSEMRRAPYTGSSLSAKVTIY